MFVDTAKMFIKAGKGGDGKVAFVREKYVERGGPCGGHGGRGGSVIFVGEGGLSTLLDFRFMTKIVAKDGEPGGDKNCFGHKGEDIVVKVPIGTMVINEDTGKVIADITKDGQISIIARGGRGGKGNAAYKSSVNTTPQYAEKGLAGEEFNARLELKVLADVGLVGFPSVGKSTLISVVSAAKPKIAAYHFTTLAPNLGVVSVPDGRSFVMADLPGLIEGASSGSGLGIEFLKHIERTKIIVHVIDMSAEEGRDPIKDYEIIRNELLSYKQELENRPEIIVANKMDMPSAKQNLEAFKKAINKEVIPISAYTKDNLNELLYKIADKLDYVKENEKEDSIIDEVVEYNFKKSGPKFRIFMDEYGTYNFEGPEVKKYFDQTDFDNEISVRRFAKALRDLGVDDALRAEGVTDGETILILGFEFEMIA